MKKLSKFNLILVILSIIILNIISFIVCRSVFLGRSGILLLLVFGWFMAIPLIILHFYANIKLNKMLLENFNINKSFSFLIVILPIILAFGSYKIAYNLDMNKYITTNYGQSYSILDKIIYSNENGDYTVNYILTFDNDKETLFVATYDIGGYYDKDEYRYSDNYKSIKRGNQILDDGYIDTVIFNKKVAIMGNKMDYNNLILLLELDSNTDSEELATKLQKIYNHYNKSTELYMAVYFCRNIEDYSYEKQCLIKALIPDDIGRINKKYSKAIYINDTTSYSAIQNEIENNLSKFDTN